MTQLHKPALVLGIPTRGMHSHYFSQCKNNMVMPTNFTWNEFYVDKQEVGRARNLLAWRAINEGARYLWFWDEDVLAPPFALKNLLFQLENHLEWTAITGVYCTKTYPPEPLVYTDWGVGPSYNWKLGELIPIKYSGLGFTLIRLSDLVDLASKVPTEDARDPWNGTPVKVPQFFNTSARTTFGPDGRTSEGHTEDAPFYKLLEENGRIAVADGNTICGHWDAGSERAFSLPHEGLIVTRPEPWNHSPRICNLGAGKNLSPYEVNVDLRGGPGISYKCDIRRLPDDWSETFDVVKAEQVLEHFPYDESGDLVNEWTRLLKPGGRLWITVPNLEWAANYLLTNGLDPFVLGMIYGDQGNDYWNQGPYGGEHAGRFLDYSTVHNFHNAGFTAASLVRLFESAGLTEVRTEPRGNSIFCEGVRPRGEESDNG